ncbi:hypothetical protein AK812_SmicGene4882 [Symbiodinium microadriaticum]|uniref:Globin family profile domain-containing protein n=1 Tax=Symbiodinium microadriaticum TaxID=2951 RepID=A0A1Q9EV88_SYMMI|nr:hypothetical protein AK812_SmicGene4882 [Symbiodinium microadriaticum]CAE7330419.1 unnamed protein product [Symbiodinium sp. KB8]
MTSLTKYQIVHWMMTGHSGAGMLQFLGEELARELRKALRLNVLSRLAKDAKLNAELSGMKAEVCGAFKVLKGDGPAMEAGSYDFTSKSRFQEAEQRGKEVAELREKEAEEAEKLKHRRRREEHGNWRDQMKIIEQATGLQHSLQAEGAEVINFWYRRLGPKNSAKLVQAEAFFKGASKGADSLFIMDAQDVIDMVELDDFTVKEVQTGWKIMDQKGAFLEFFESLKGVAPRSAPMLKRAHAAWEAFGKLVAGLGEASQLRSSMEFCALRHMSVALQQSDVDSFKAVLLDVCSNKLAALLTPEFQFGVSMLVDSMGRTMLRTRNKFETRLRILRTSWTALEHSEGEKVDVDSPCPPDSPDEEGEPQSDDNGPVSPSERSTGERKHRKSLASVGSVHVPRSFHDMVLFNASVMNMGENTWFEEMLRSLRALVPNCGNISRLQEECDLLCLALVHYENVELSNFKQVMLASLRSLLPSQWNMEHENAWSWFWDGVETRLTTGMPLSSVYMNHLQSFLRMDEEACSAFKMEVFETFFATCEQSQEYLKASNAKLQFIAGRILDIMTDMFRTPQSAVKDISALGLLHAGYGVREELIQPFVTAFMTAVKNACPEESWISGVQWTFEVVSRTLARTMAEGSTAVMRSITKNSAKQLEEAVASAPRGQREQMLLRVQVGTESISPVLWAIQSGALHSAEAILKDLLTIRADRARYYYGMEGLWDRHPDIVPLLCKQAPSLMEPLLDGLMWRSKQIKGGVRRVNYYISRILVEEGGLAPSMHQLVKHSDPSLLCHPCTRFVFDLLWAKMCCFAFIVTKLWFVLTLVDFVVGLQYGILMFDSAGPGRWALIGCRLFMYIFSLGQLFIKHTTQFAHAYKEGRTLRCFKCFRVPAYLFSSRQEFVEFVLAVFLFAMLTMEPFLHCLNVDDRFVTNCCEHGEFYCSLSDNYDRISTIPMLLYFILASDLVHLNIHLSSFVVICTSLWWEFVLYLGALGFVATAFASAIACLPQTGADDSVQLRDFYHWPSAFQSLLSMSLSMYSGNSFEEINTATEVPLKWWIIAFGACWHIFLTNLMIAHFCESYRGIFQDAMGHAWLTRGTLILETAMPLVSLKKWKGFVESLKLEEPCELDEGDVGPRGGVATAEGPFEHLKSPGVELDRVRRFGGLASIELPWPEEKADKEDDSEKLQKMTCQRFDEQDRMLREICIKLGIRASGLTGSSPGSIMAQSQASDRPKARFDVLEGSSSIPADDVLEENSDATELVEDPSRHNSMQSPKSFGRLGSQPFTSDPVVD